ncbi:MAG: hypothetical protein LBM08_07015, partial [Dysgonamonadaceae bacterium]|nr:hypothetical protein [Dysgonamonadaceae bacterium]
DINNYIAVLGAIPLATGSVALTKGNVDYLLTVRITTDQLGNERQNPACAVGAVEIPVDEIVTPKNEDFPTSKALDEGTGGTVDLSITGYTSYALSENVKGADVTRSAKAVSIPTGVSIDQTSGLLSIADNVAAGGYEFYVVASKPTSEISYKFTLEITAGTGLNPVVAGKSIQSVSYYDLTGKPVPAGTKGFVITKTVYEDGGIINKKAMVK